jgi:hypothetical protein
LSSIHCKLEGHITHTCRLSMYKMFFFGLILCGIVMSVCQMKSVLCIMSKLQRNLVNDYLNYVCTDTVTPWKVIKLITNPTIMCQILIYVLLLICYTVHGTEAFDNHVFHNIKETTENVLLCEQVKYSKI